MRRWQYSLSAQEDKGNKLRNIPFYSVYHSKKHKKFPHPIIAFLRKIVQTPTAWGQSGRSPTAEGWRWWRRSPRTRGTLWRWTVMVPPVSRDITSLSWLSSSCLTSSSRSLSPSSSSSTAGPDCSEASLILKLTQQQIFNRALPLQIPTWICSNNVVFPV